MSCLACMSAMLYAEMKECMSVKHYIRHVTSGTHDDNMNIYMTVYMSAICCVKRDGGLVHPGLGFVIP